MLDSVILIFMCIVVVFGSLVIYFEDYSPNVLNRLLMYGAFGHRGPGNKIWNYIEIPMAHYRDFYVFATFFNVLSLIYMASVYFLEWEVNELIFRTLKLLCSRSESVSMASAITTVLLFTLQCLRRLYETFYIQVFSESAKMNLLHFVMAITHYFICVIAFGFGSAPLFSGKQTRDSMPWIDTYTKYVAAPCIVVFIMSWYEQYRTNIILANLRKDKKTGEVVSMGYRVPHGRLFEYTSSPHRLCEIFIYVALAVLKPTTTNIYICIWVFSNQLQAAVAAHKWYIKTFKNYPSNRTALIPFLF